MLTTGDDVSLVAGHRDGRCRTVGLQAALTLGVLLAGDRLNQAETFCDQISTSAEDGDLQALVTSFRALVWLRAGAVPQARQLSEDAVARLGPSAWGSMIGLPLSVLVSACCLMGDVNEAARHLQTPLPDEAFTTVAGLLYLQARGFAQLVRGQTYTAASDFHRCGQVAVATGLDLPGLVAWRLDLARAHVELGHSDEARDLAHQQLSLLLAHESRLRGRSLRTLAAASPIRHRVPLLRRAVADLAESGPGIELACARAELSRALSSLGQSDATGELDRAVERHLSKNPWLQMSSVEFATKPERESIRRLSPAERRVAELAAGGLTNREISGELHITMSTVEQHLTRVYQKLGIVGRSDLRSQVGHFRWSLDQTPGSCHG